MSDLYLVFSQPPEEIPAEDYQRWYAQHIRDNLRTPGFDAATRYSLAHTVPGSPESFSHLAAYECRGDIEQLRANLHERTREGDIPLPEWFPAIRFSSWHCRVIEPRVASE